MICLKWFLFSITFKYPLFEINFTSRYLFDHVAGQSAVNMAIYLKTVVKIVHPMTLQFLLLYPTDPSCLFFDFF